MKKVWASNEQVNDLINSNSKEDIMRDLGINSAWEMVEEYMSTDSIVRCDADGKDTSIEDYSSMSILQLIGSQDNDARRFYPANVSVISEDREDKALDIGDRVGNAELCIWVDDTEMYYERDFDDVERGIPFEDTLITMSAYVAVEQQDTNFKYYSSRVSMCKSIRDLAIIASIVISAQKRVDNGMFFFRKGMSKVFWDAYKAKKADVSNNQRLTLLELEDIIASSNTAGQLKRAKMCIYDSNLLYGEKRKLWDICDERILSLCA